MSGVCVYIVEWQKCCIVYKVTCKCYDDFYI